MSEKRDEDVMAEVEEVSREEYQSQERQRARYRDQERAYQNQVNSLDDEIRRLEKARRAMVACNSEFKKQYSNFDKYMHEKLEFAGNKKKTIMDNQGRILLSEAKYARDNVINRALDELEWLLWKKKDERDAAYGALGKVRSALRYVDTWLRTHFFN